MKTALFSAFILTSALFFFGCGGGDDDSGTTTTNVVVVTNAAAPVVTNAPAAPDANAAFANITPGGLSADKFTIAGRGTVYTFQCAVVPGAVSYTFTTSLGYSETVPTPEYGVNIASPPAGEVTYNVYATNANGVNTKTATGTIN